jgi:hypothetical protein
VERGQKMRRIFQNGLGLKRGEPPDCAQGAPAADNKKPAEAGSGRVTLRCGRTTPASQPSCITIFGAWSSTKQTLSRFVTGL